MNQKKKHSALEVLQHNWFKNQSKKNNSNEKLAKSTLENIKRFKRDKQFE